MAESIIKTYTAPVDGKRIVYFTQSILDPIGSKAVMPAYQTEGGMTLAGDNTDEQTKQGRIIKKSTDEHTIDLTQYYTPGDKSVEDVETAKIDGHSIKVWRVVVDPENAKEGSGPGVKLYPSHFGYGMPGDLEFTDGDELASLSYTLNIVGALKKGYFPLSDEDIAMIESVYDYENPGETTGDYTEKGSTSGV